MFATVSNTLVDEYIDLDLLPKHVAIIMDGNGRWAQERGWCRSIGHRQGAKALKEIIRACKDWKIEILTVYAFSTENWRRSINETSFLMQLFQDLLRGELAELHEEGVKLKILGDIEDLPMGLQQEINRCMWHTADNTTLTLNVAINYGGRREISNACREIGRQVAAGNLAAETIDETTIERYLSTSQQPDPDLVIRTGGEMRISNFLLWQIAYSELYITKTLWPEFDRRAFQNALASYRSRDRRFGKNPA